MKKLKNIDKYFNINSIEILAPTIFILIILIVWQIISDLGIVPKFMLPSPLDVLNAFINDFSLIIYNTKITLIEAFLGLFIGVIIAFFISFFMDMSNFIFKALYPVLVLTQTIPTVAIAPLLVLWFGYGIMPKVVLIILTSFFPVTVGLIDGFKSVDKDAENLMKTMGANKLQIFYHLKLLNSIGYFFAGLRISVSYSIVGAVVAEWLGGFEGLGVYMTRVRKSYSFDKMFAVIFFISFLSLILMEFVKFIQKKSMKWVKNDNKK